MIDAYATLPHYVDHLAPIWWALTPDERGVFYTSRAGEARARREGLWPLEVGRPVGAHRPTLVGGYADLRGMGRRPAIFVEHGAGQTYEGDPKGVRDASYSGGRDRQQVRLFLASTEAVHQRNLEGTPTAASAVVGVPKLDWWHRSTGALSSTDAVKRDIRAKEIQPDVTPTVAVSFHWDCRLVPESRSAWAHYDGALDALVAAARQRGWRLLGHGHPRIFGRLARRWEQLGVEAVPDFDQVLRRADCYVVDNSSTLYEFAALAGPVVVLNAPWYRRDVHHGLRFWDTADIGVNVDQPEDLVTSIEIALADPPAQRLVRRQRAFQVYGVLDGHAAERAANAIRAHML